MPSLLTAGISEEDAQARAISSMTIDRREGVAALAAVGLGDVHRLQPGPGQGVERLGREPCLGVDRGRERGDLRLGDLTGGLPQQLVLFAQRVHQRRSW